MSNLSVRQWLSLGCRVILALFLLWVGVRLLFFDDQLSSAILLSVGMLIILTGIVGFSSNIGVFSILALIALYFLARASGQIEGAWLARLAGFACLLLSGFVIYTLYTKSKTKDLEDIDI